MGGLQQTKSRAGSRTKLHTIPRRDALGQLGEREVVEHALPDNLNGPP